MVQAQGHMGSSVTFDGQWVTISRAGAQRLTHGRGDKRLHVSQISAVHLKPAGALTNGFIQFTISGGADRQAAKGRRTVQAAQDENSVIFTRKQQSDFDRLRQAVEDAIAAVHAPQAAPSAPASASSEIQRLWELHQQGALTRAQYDEQVARLTR
jgi:hypothetical protein